MKRRLAEGTVHGKAASPHKLVLSMETRAGSTMESYDFAGYRPIVKVSWRCLPSRRSMTSC
jgi:hypothetical protein